MKHKKCNKCNDILPNTEEYFYKKRNTLENICKICKRILQYKKRKEDKTLFYRKLINNKWYKQCTSCELWVEDNFDYFSKSNNKTISKCKSCCSQRKKEYDLKNKNKINRYREKNKDKISKYHKNRNSSPTKFETKKVKELSKYENILENLDGFAETICTYCSKKFLPTNREIESRLGAINGTATGQNRLYCSDHYKQACPTYGQLMYPKGFKKSTSREVQPELRKLVLERDNWECQKCGKTQEESQLHCHHKEGIHHNPIESADIDMCITFCKECHKKVHTEIEGCTYQDMRCAS